MMPESFADPQVRMVRVADFDLTRDIGILYAGGVDAAAYAASPFLTLVREHYDGAGAGGASLPGKVAEGPRPA